MAAKKKPGSGRQASSKAGPGGRAAKRASRRSAAAPKSSGGTLPAWVTRANARRAAWWSGVAAFFLAVGLGATLGVAALDRRAAGSLANDPAELALILPEPARFGLPWPPEAQLNSLYARLREAAGPPRPLSGVPLAQAGRELEASGWVVGRPSVRRARVGEQERIEIDAEWRRPAAVVRWRGRDRLVSWEGLQIPLDYPAGTSPWRAIVGASLGPPAGDTPADRYATPWPGEDVAQALTLLELLEPVPEVFARVRAVDVTAVASGGMIELIDLDGGRVVWGSTAARWSPGEAEATQKVDRLRALVQRGGTLDGGAGSGRVEIFGASVEVDRTMTPAGGAAP